MKKDVNRLKKQLNSDQILQLNALFERFERIIVIRCGYPDMSRISKCARLSALLELMDILDYEFDTKYAACNALVGLHEMNVVSRDNIVGNCKVCDDDTPNSPML